MRKRIVIIEDDRDILELLTLIFIDADYFVDGFSTGKTPQEIELLSPGILLLDISLIGYSKRGDQICKDMKAYFPTSHIPIMLLSAEKDLPFLAACAGADCFLPKPFDIDRLLSMTSRLAQ